MATINSVREALGVPAAAEIVRLHSELVAEAQRSLQKAIDIGARLVGVKSTMPHGSWMTWCEDAIPQISERTIRNYMRVFNNRQALMAQNITDPAAAYKALAVPKRQSLPVSNVTFNLNPNAPLVPILTQSQVLDEMGYPIPQASQAFWNRKDEVIALMDALIRTRKAVDVAGETRDKMFNELNFPAFLADIENAYRHLIVVIPYAVCPSCNGLTIERCSTCRGRGLVSKFYWDHKVPKAMKETRENVIRLRKEIKQ